MYNINTGKCIKRSGKVGRKLQGLTKPNVNNTLANFILLSCSKISEAGAERLIKRIKALKSKDLEDILTSFDTFESYMHMLIGYQKIEISFLAIVIFLLKRHEITAALKNLKHLEYQDFLDHFVITTLYKIVKKNKDLQTKKIIKNLESALKIISRKVKINSKINSVSKKGPEPENLSRDILSMSPDIDEEDVNELIIEIKEFTIDNFKDDLKSFKDFKDILEILIYGRKVHLTSAAIAIFLLKSKEMKAALKELNLDYQDFLDHFVFDTSFYADTKKTYDATNSYGSINGVGFLKAEKNFKMLKLALKMIQ